MAFPSGRGGSRGRGSSRGRGRGGSGPRGRGRGRGRGRPAGPRNHGFKMEDWSGGEQFGAYKPKEHLHDEEEVFTEIEEDAEDDTFDVASAAPMAYDALLTLMKPETQREAPQKKRKVETTQEKVDYEDDQGSADEEAEEADVADAQNLDMDIKADDPFETHFNHLDAIDLQSRCQRVEQKQWTNKVTKNATSKVLEQSLDDLDDAVWDTTDSTTWHLKQRLTAHAKAKVAGLATEGHMQQFQSGLFHYKDISYCTSSYKQTSKLRPIYCLHSLNHIFKTRDRILKNNAKLTANTDPEVEFRDQGFTRPKILILLPTRHACLLVVNELIAASGAEQVENRKRFNEQFGTEGIDPLKNANKPEDFKAHFAGNTDDAFRIGIKFTRKTIKLFSQFYGSDIIVASPLGLRMAIGDAGSKKRDWDYLSSIELVILDGANTMAMQNWEHVDYCFEYFNLLPKESHGCDYGRVRHWALDERTRYLRQTVFISDYEFPELRHLSASLKNIAGSLRLKGTYDGAIQATGIAIRQTFQRFESPAPSDEPDARFQFFRGTTLPRLRKLAQVDGDAGAGCLLFVPSYFDFVRVRNYLTSLEISFEALSEYSTTSDLTRGRHLFASGKTPILLMTERLHHYRRYDIKGVKNVFFYQLPEHAHYFTELVRCAAGQGTFKADGEVRIGFSRWDESRLERIVGTKRIGKMLSGKDATFEFM